MEQTQKFAKRKRRIISPAHREAIRQTLREGYRTGRYDRPVGNRINHCTGPRPWVWKHGPDPVIKAQNMAMLPCGKIRNQNTKKGPKHIFSVWEIF